MGRRVEELSITLTADVALAVRDAVDAGEYDAASAVVSDALRDWRQKRSVRETLRADVQVGMADLEAGRVEDFDADRIIAKGSRKRSARCPSG